MIFILIKFMCVFKLKLKGFILFQNTNRNFIENITNIIAVVYRIIIKNCISTTLFNRDTLSRR